MTFGLCRINLNKLFFRIFKYNLQIDVMGLNFKQAFNALMNNRQSFFTNVFFGGKVIDIGDYNREEVVEAYRTCAEARLVIDKVVDSFASIPVKWVDKNGEDIDTPEVGKILMSPNALQTRKQFERSWILQWCLFDENAVYSSETGVGMSRGKLEWLKVLPGQYLAYELDESGAIVKVVNSYNQTKRLDLDRVKITAGDILDPRTTLHATSKLVTASKILKEIEQGHVMNITAYGNKGANYLVTADGEITFDKQQAINAQEQINNTNLKGGVRFMGSKAQVHDISKTPADLDILETSKDSRKVLGLLYGVPIPLISEDASTYDNVRESERSLALNTTIPLKELYCEQMTEFLAPKGNERLVVDVDKVKQIQRNPKEVQEVLNMAKASVNERRKAANLPELPDSIYDEPLMSIQDQAGFAPDIEGLDLQ